MIWRHEEHPAPDGRRLRVALPEGYDDAGGDYPVLVCLDAQWTFGTVCDAALSLGLARFVPRVIVVGVGWQANAAREVTALRATAFTPTEAEVPSFVGAGEAVRGGGGPAYLRWLVHDALPDLEANYRIRREEHCFVGHSLSALLGVHALLDGDGPFRRWLLASPSSWWDGGSLFERERTTPPLSLAGQRAFLSVGSEEEQVGAIPMRANTERLADCFEARRAQGLDSTFVVLDGETHHSTVPAAISRGLRWLFR